MKRLTLKQFLLTSILMLTATATHLFAQNPPACVGGTLLFRQDFGGNSSSDPMSGSLPFTVGSTEIPFSAVGPSGAAYYSLAKNANTVYSPEFHHADDHTYPNDFMRGYLMVVHSTSNASSMMNTINQVIFKTDIDSLCDGMKLSFSAWFLDVNSLNASIALPPIIRMQVLNKQNGSIIHETSDITIPKGNVWKQHGFDFILPAGVTSISFKIINKQPKNTGNDLGIDDIEIRFCAPPVSISIPDSIEQCGGTPLVLNGNYIDNGTFGNNLSYRWEYSATGSINTASEWTVVNGSQGVSTNGTISSTHTIPALAAQHTGYYRLVVGTTSTIQGWTCRAASNIVKVIVKTTGAYIDAPASICMGDTINISTSKPLTGVWTSSNLSIATINSSTGKVIGVGDGTVEIRYLASHNGICIDTLKTVITVDFCVSCKEGGTLLYKQDFGGNATTDPLNSSTPLPNGASDLPLKGVQPNPNNSGFYLITKNAAQAWYEFHRTGDHTILGDTTRGYLMVVDPNNGDINKILYKTDIDNLCDGMKLYFSAWYMDVSPAGVSPKIEMQMRNKADNSLLMTTGDVVIPRGKTWLQYGFYITLPAGVTSVIFQIINRETSTAGNDLGIDDIEIRFCAPHILIEVPPIIEKCVGTSAVLSAHYIDNGTFGKNLKYRWEYSTTGDIYKASDWTVVAGSQGIVADGRVISEHTISSLTMQDTGYYRLVVGTPSTIDLWNCRAVSDVIKLEVIPFPNIAPITSTGNIVCANTDIQLSCITSKGVWTLSNSKAQIMGSNTANTVSIRGVSEGNVYATYTVGGICQSKSTFLLKSVSSTSKILIGF